MRKILNLSFALVLFLSLFSSVALADNTIQEIMDEVEEANLAIQAEIDQAVEEADEAMGEYVNDPEKLEAELDEIIEELISTTDEIAREAIEEAAEEGITVLCEFVEVKIGNRTVLVDPLTVISD